MYTWNVGESETNHKKKDTNKKRNVHANRNAFATMISSFILQCISKTMYFAINPVDGNSLRESLFKAVTMTWRNKSEEASAFNFKGSNYYWDCLKMKITYGCKIPLQNIL